jgi:hypothetical protein
MTFDEWYNEIEGFSTRGTRFEDWMSNSEDGGTGKDWLAAAYNAGFKHANELAVKKKAETAVEHDKKLNDVKLPSEGIPYPIRNAPPHIKYPTKDNPFTYPKPWPAPYTPNPWPGILSCSRCGISLYGVMGYVCSDQQCPTFVHTWSGTITGTISVGDTGPYFGGSSNIGSAK